MFRVGCVLVRSRHVSRQHGPVGVHQLPSGETLSFVLAFRFFTRCLAWLAIFRCLFGNTAFVPRVVGIFARTCFPNAIVALIRLPHVVLPVCTLRVIPQGMYAGNSGLPACIECDAGSSAASQVRQPVRRAGGGLLSHCCGCAWPGFLARFNRSGWRCGGCGWLLVS